MLIDREGIGSGQTLSSQGIIHGGIKYTLNGILSGSASVIADMPRRWQACLSGEGELDLSDTLVNSPHQLMWSGENLSSKLTTFFSSKAVSSRMKRLEKNQYPHFFQNTAFQGSIYQLHEPVLDVPSLLKNLAKSWQHRMLRVDESYALNVRDESNIELVCDSFSIQAEQLILAGGEGNEALLNELSIMKPKMQLRPLQMVLAKGANLPRLYAHGIGASSRPLLTITSHQHSDGDIVWYMGGDIAEEGVGKSSGVLINETRVMLERLLPWLDTQNLQWSTHFVNRAEPAQKKLMRPDTSFLSSKNNIHVVWPTKLALAPNLSDAVVNLFELNKIPFSDSEFSADSDNALQAVMSQYQLPISSALWERLSYAAY